MKTWIRTEDGVIKQVIVAQDLPAGDDNWEEYPYPSDLAGAGNISGRSLTEFDEIGNFIPLETIAEDATIINT